MQPSNSTVPYENALEKDGRILFTPGGVSMLPLLKNHKNPVIILPVKGWRKPGKYDVVFYKRDNGQYVLHRIIKVEKDALTYTCCGDGQYSVERGVRIDMIFGRLAGYYKGERYIDVSSSAAYRIYSVLRVADRPLRSLFHRSVHLIGRIFKKHRPR